MTTRKFSTVCVFGADAESIGYASASLAPQFRVVPNPPSVDECDTLILIDETGIEGNVCDKLPLLLCGSSVLLLRELGVRGIAAAAAPDYWDVLESSGITPLPFEVHSEGLIVTCSERKHLRIALRAYKRILECIVTGDCIEPRWAAVIKCSRETRSG